MLLTVIVVNGVFGTRHAGSVACALAHWIACLSGTYSRMRPPICSNSGYMLLNCSVCWPVQAVVRQ